MRIKYREGYKYQLAETYQVEISIPITVAIRTEFIDLEAADEFASLLIIKAGYAWDGPSGPTLDTRDSMRPSLVHDALYQLMRQGHLSQDYREAADNILFDMLIEDGMDKHRAGRWKRMVRIFAGSAADPESVKEVHEAP